jgi:hypothetical protein
MRLRCWLNKTIDQMLLQASVSPQRVKADLMAYATDCKAARDMADEQEQLLREWVLLTDRLIPNCPRGAETIRNLRNRSMALYQDEEY